MAPKSAELAILLGELGSVASRAILFVEKLSSDNAFRRAFSGNPREVLNQFGFSRDLLELPEWILHSAASAAVPSMLLQLETGEIAYR